MLRISSFVRHCQRTLFNKRTWEIDPSSWANDDFSPSCGTLPIFFSLQKHLPCAMIIPIEWGHKQAHPLKGTARPSQWDQSKGQKGQHGNLQDTCYEWCRWRGTLLLCKQSLPAGTLVQCGSKKDEEEKEGFRPGAPLRTASNERARILGHRHKRESSRVARGDKRKKSKSKMGREGGGGGGWKDKEAKGGKWCGPVVHPTLASLPFSFLSMNWLWLG